MVVFETIWVNFVLICEMPRLVHCCLFQAIMGGKDLGSGDGPWWWCGTVSDEETKGITTSRRCHRPKRSQWKLKLRSGEKHSELFPCRQYHLHQLLVRDTRLNNCYIPIIIILVLRPRYITGFTADLLICPSRWMLKITHVCMFSTNVLSP